MRGMGFRGQTFFIFQTPYVPFLLASVPHFYGSHGILWVSWNMCEAVSKEAGVSSRRSGFS